MLRSQNRFQQLCLLRESAAVFRVLEAATIWIGSWMEGWTKYRKCMVWRHLIKISSFCLVAIFISVCLLLKRVPHPSVSRSAITCCWYMVASRCWQNFTLSQGGGLILNKLMIFSLLINGATAVDCYQFSGLSLAGDVSTLIPSTTKVYSARAETTEMNTVKGW